jgi:hypothetical protein
VLLAEGRARLAPFAPACQGVDVARLIADTVKLEEALARLGPERMAALDPARIPTIRLAGPQAEGSSTGTIG